MKPTLALLVVLCGCGVPSLEPSHARAGVTEQPATNAPVDCHALCLAIRPQLIRDFAVRAEDIDCEQRMWWAASDCEACREVVRINYAVELTSCR